MPGRLCCFLLIMVAFLFQTNNHMLAFRILSGKPWMLCCYLLIMVDFLFQTNNHMLGPKPFPLDRLMAVFYAIVEGKVAPTANIFMQVK